MVLSLPVVLAIVFIINVIPAFMPPTWAFLAYVYVTQGGDPLALAVLGAVFSTLGRVVLAKWSGPLIYRFLNKPVKRNIEYAGREFGKRPLAGFLVSLIYSLGPFPSNTLFIVGGAAKIRLVPIVAGFFVGRVISYYALVSAAHFTFGMIRRYLEIQNPYVWVTDIVGLLLAVAVLMIDWGSIFGRRQRKR